MCYEICDGWRCFLQFCTCMSIKHTICLIVPSFLFNITSNWYLWWSRGLLNCSCKVIKPGTFSQVHTGDTKTVTPALRQTVTAISTTNTWCTIFKRDSFNIKVHIVYKVLALVLAIISLLDQQKNNFTFTASRNGGDSFRVHCVYLTASSWCEFEVFCFSQWLMTNTFKQINRKLTAISQCELPCELTVM